MDELVALFAGRRVVALTGAGCSTASGIPDYRGATAARTRRQIQHREFVERADVRQRYWARSVLGWPRLAGARPNPAHTALAALETAGVVAGVITQNVDGLHQAAGSAAVIELHGGLARVRCLGCAALTPRSELQTRLVAANQRWSLRAEAAAIAPDGDAELPEDLVAGFELVGCACGGVLMPDVVFFGGSVPRATLDAAWTIFERGEVLLVAGSSLTVFSGFRFVHRAAERGVPVAIVNRGPTRGDQHATVRLDRQVEVALPELARRLGFEPIDRFTATP